jgi:hypothetical protein
MTLHEDFRAAWAAGSEAKAAVMAALGEAKLAEKEGRDADAAKAWKVVETQGMTSGFEGQKKALARAIADAWVDANPDAVQDIKGIGKAYQITNPGLRLTDQQALVPYVDVLRAAGQVDKLAEVEMYLLSAFEPQHIGGRVQATVRIRGAK